MYSKQTDEKSSLIVLRNYRKYSLLFPQIFYSLSRQQILVQMH